ncbi:hypothetical protein ACFSEO_17955 [Agromyces cerinus subsp. nitratus]|uniref:hypothetical protein n=2 Tax=Agromyces cerinus TaxID=33878 RepID=UPI00363E0411
MHGAIAVAATLTTVFGAPPTVEEDPGSSGEPPSTVHRWDGFELREPRYGGVAADMAPSLSLPNFRVVFTTAASGDVELTTTSGRVVGESWSDFAASPDAAKNGLCVERYGEVVVLPMTCSDGTVEDARNSIEFQPSDDETVIASVEARRVRIAPGTRPGHIG